MEKKANIRALFCEGEVATSHYIIYTPSQFARDSLLYLQETGTLTAVKPYETGRKDLESYLFFVVLSGSGRIVYEGNSYDLHAGDCVFLDCRKPYSQITGEDLWTLQWVHFQGSTMDGIYQKYREHGGKPVFSTDNQGKYQEILNEIYASTDGNSYLHSIDLAEKLLALLKLLMEETQSRSREEYRSVRKLDIKVVKAWLDEHYREAFTLDHLAEHFFIDKYYLTKIFKAEYDTTINNYLNQVRITRAKELLRFTDLTVEAVGREVGIQEQNYFARVFKKIEGTAPSLYRARWNQEK